MILPTPEVLERRRRGYRRRGAVTVLAVLLMLGSAVLPHIGVQAFDVYGRALIGASRFFLVADAGSPGLAGAEVGRAALGINLAYLGLAAHQVGLVTGIASFWALAAEGIGRWIRRIVLVSGWLLCLSAVLVVSAYQALETSGVPSRLGVAWVFALGAGLVMVLGGLEARKRLDSTWYWTRPDLNG